MEKKVWRVLKKKVISKVSRKSFWPFWGSDRWIWCKWFACHASDAGIVQFHLVVQWNN